ncbi:MAG: GAF domain-containing protein, partial [Actinobacteria bacterium]|nr:GAF domain-containing protein [Actinomycetota bacterium]
MTETGPGSSYLGTATDEDRERARAGALRDYDVLESERHPELDSLAELAARACGCPWSSIALVDHELLYPVSVYGYSAPVQSRGGRMSAAILAVLGDSVMMIPDAQQDPRFSDNPYVTGELMSFRMIATAPLRTPAGHSIGIVSVSHPEARELDDDTVRLLRTVARQIVDTLELRRRSRISQEIINELSRSQQQLAHFASQVSHDLKTPLTATI